MRTNSYTVPREIALKNVNLRVMPRGTRTPTGGLMCWFFHPCRIPLPPSLALFDSRAAFQPQPTRERNGRPQH